MEYGSGGCIWCIERMVSEVACALWFDKESGTVCGECALGVEERV